MVKLINFDMAWNPVPADPNWEVASKWNLCVKEKHILIANWVKNKILFKRFLNVLYMLNTGPSSSTKK